MFIPYLSHLPSPPVPTFLQVRHFNEVENNVYHLNTFVNNQVIIVRDEMENPFGQICSNNWKNSSSRQHNQGFNSSFMSIKTKYYP